MIKKVNPNYIVKRFVDLPDTPDTITNGKMLTVKADETGIELVEDIVNVGSENITDLELDYISGFGMESCNYEADYVYSGIKINRGICEIAEPGDFTNSVWWDYRTSKLLFNSPHRNLNGRDISGHPNTTSFPFNIRYDPDFDEITWGTKKTIYDGDEILIDYNSASNFAWYSSLHEYDYNETKQLTISARFKITSSGANNTLFADWLYPSGGSYSLRKWRIVLDGTNPISFVCFQTSSLYFRYNFNYTFNTDQDYHILFEIDTTQTQKVRLWVDNVEIVDYTIPFDTTTTDNWYYNGSYDYNAYTIGGRYHHNINELFVGIIKSVLLFNRVLSQSEKDYLYNNTYLTHTPNTNPNSDIYTLDEDIIIDTNDFGNWVLDDGTPSTPEIRWYYIYALPDINNKVSIKVSWLCPLRNRFNVSQEGFNPETLYHPFKNARCIGIFKYGGVFNINENKKVITFKMVNGRYQQHDLHVFHDNNQTYNKMSVHHMVIPHNIHKYTYRTYYNAFSFPMDGLFNEYGNDFMRQRNQTIYDAYTYDFHEHNIISWSPFIAYRQYWLENGTNRVYLVFNDFTFKQ